MTAIGPHLLGRVPAPPDERDYQVAWFLNQDPLDAALEVLKRSPQVAKATKAWAIVAQQRIQAFAPAPAPTPAPVTDVLWPDPTQLDQGDTGHCVGFGWAQFGASDPFEDHYTDDDGHAIYYECKVIDGEPRQENGSDVRSGAKAMLNRNRLAAYAFAKSTDEITGWLRAHGPVVVGTDWHTDMFTPDPSGRVGIGGQIEGGHCYLIAGVDAAGQVYQCQNSWGTGWGMYGRFSITVDAFAQLLAAQGDACVAAELPL